MRSVGSWQDRLIDGAALSRPDLLAGRDPRTLNMSRLGEILLDEQPPVQAMIVWNCNPLVIVPNAEKARVFVSTPVAWHPAQRSANLSLSHSPCGFWIANLP